MLAVASTSCTQAQLRQFAQLVQAYQAEQKEKSGDAPTEAFVGKVSSISRTELGASWDANCPVEPADLRMLTVTYWGFDSQPHIGHMVVNELIAIDTVDALRSMYQARFPIASMVSVHKYITKSAAKANGYWGVDLSNNAYGYMCRAKVGGSGWSTHAYGMAVDINAMRNPYVSGSTVIPKGATRSLSKGRLDAGDSGVTSFTSEGFVWGGSWSRAKDYMHFQPG